MARTETVLQAFVASPSDVSEERALLEEIVRELNLTWSKTFGLRIELLKWETHAYPDMGSTSQEVVSRQIGYDFDIFIGMMWGKFGTPTGKFGSGTEEEFESAHKLFLSGKHKLWIMCYFKDAGIPPSQIDLSQLELVNGFRAKLGDEGALYWKFQSKDEFSKLLRLHLSRVIQEWREKNELPSPGIAMQTIEEPVGLVQVEIAEDGYLDFLEKAFDHGAKVEEVASRLANIMSLIAQKITERTEELNKALANTSAPRPAVLRSVRRITDLAAEDVDDFATRLQLETPILKNSFEVVIDCLTKAITWETKGKNTDQASITGAIDASSALIKTLDKSLSHVTTLKQSIVNLPNVSARFNASGRRAIKELNRLIDQFTIAIKLTQEAQSVFKALESQ